MTPVTGGMLNFFKGKKMKRMTYAEYIKSSQWRRKANDAKERAGYRCQLCNAAYKPNKLHAHHRTYERLGHEDVMDLTVLCIPCHELFHSALAIETNGLFTTALVEPIKLKKGIDEIL